MARISDKNDRQVITNEVRLSYVNLFTPKSVNGGDEKYSVSLLIPKDDKETIDCINQAVESAKEDGKDKFGGKIPPNLKLPLRDGDTERDDEVYKGHYFVNANANLSNPPGIVDKFGKRIEDSTEVYSGCYAKASIVFYAFNSSGNKGIACGLNNIMKTRDGEPLSGKTGALSDFADDFESAEEAFLD